MKNLQKINKTLRHNLECDSVAYFGRLRICKQLRAGLHYSEEVHRSVKSLSPRQSHLSQRLVLEDKMEKEKENLKLEFSENQVSCQRV